MLYRYLGLGSLDDKIWEISNFYKFALFFLVCFFFLEYCTWIKEILMKANFIIVKVYLYVINFFLMPYIT